MMSQTTMKIDRDVLDGLKELAAASRRSPQNQLRFMVDREKSKLNLASEVLTPEQQARADAVRQTEASEALEGYAPLSEEGGYAYELQQRWIRGEITSIEHGRLLAEHFGYEYIE